MEEASINQIKLLRKLSKRKYREKENLFVVEGERAVKQIIDHNFLEIVTIFVVEANTSDYELFANSFLLDQKTFDEVSNTETPQGVLAICKMPKSSSISELISLDFGVIVATDAIQDPGNLGTIIRTATWFGTDAIILGTGTVDTFNPKVVRSTVGSTGTLPFLTGNLIEVIGKLEEAGWNTLLLDGNQGSIPVNQIKNHKKTILVVGNEANGISKELITPNRQRVLIPSKSLNKSIESLNAAVALSIGLWCVNN